MINAIIGALTTILTTLIGRKKMGAHLEFSDLLITDGSTVIGEHGINEYAVVDIDPKSPALDIWIHNTGGRNALIRRMFVEVTHSLYIPPIDPPTVLPGLDGTSSSTVLYRRVGPSYSYHVQLPATGTSNSYRVKHELGPDESDRFIASLDIQEEEQGKEFHWVKVRVEFNGRKSQIVSEPMMLMPSGRPVWESPETIREHMMDAIQKRNEIIGSDGVDIVFNGKKYPFRDGLIRYVEYYESKLKILEECLEGCNKSHRNPTTYSAFLSDVRAALDEVPGLLVIAKKDTPS